MSKAKCRICGDVMESKHAWDFVRCKRGKAFLDGGDRILRGNKNTIVFEFKGKSYDDEGWS